MRNQLYDSGILKSKTFEIPIICVGNLSVGGTGKTPMIEYLIRLLKEHHRVATLSRGYKRKTKGFVIADANASALTLGDEPFQFYSKFEGIIVSVDSKRVRGISNLLRLKEPPEVILLDDAFQHRKVKAGLNILLTTYDNLYADDILLPTGNLREPRSGAKRANIVIVTKCPDYIDETDMSLVLEKLNLASNQDVFFSSIKYSEKLISKDKVMDISNLQSEKFSLVTGIANATPLVEYLSNKGFEFDHFNFPDHYHYSDKDIENLNNMGVILTTEKDYMRLMNRIDQNRLFYLPIETQVSNRSDLDQLIQKFAAN